MRWLIYVKLLLKSKGGFTQESEVREMNELPKNRQHAAMLLATGQMDKSDIAKEVGISRQSLWLWERDDQKMMAEVDRLRREFKSQGENFLLGKVNAVLHDIYELSQSAESEKVRLEALKYMGDQAIGKATSKLEIDASNIQEISNPNSDLLATEYDDVIDHVTADNE